MPQDNKIKELIINQLTKEQYKELKDNNQLSNTELYIITNNANYTEEEILTLLSSKQNKLTAGDGVTIEGDTITINLDDFYTSNAIDELLKNKSNVSDAGHSLDYTGNTLTLQDINGNELSSVGIIYNPEVDNVTINLSNTNKLQSIGEITRNGTPKYTWIGTQEEYEQAKLNGVITEFTEILITDSEAEIVSPIVQYNAPTKISDLANDMNFVSNDDLQSVKSDLENKINTGIDDTNLVHKDGNETIDGFKQFKEKIVIENGQNKGRIAHKPINSSLEDGYIEFGDNILIYGKQNINGELFDESHNIFHDGNLIAGDNISITEEYGVYKINSGAFSSADIDLSNLSTAGNNKFDIKADKATTLGGYGITDGLNKSQITNCITEIPQRIKYTLENGTLTMHAGSVVIVPYGTEDKTSLFPKGATFLHENFKVYDTQFADGKFFVWAEIQSDIATTANTSMGNGLYTFGVKPEGNTFSGRLANTQQGSGDGSNLESNDMYYHTGTNAITQYLSGVNEDINCSFPTFLINKDDTGFASIDQVFNGMGYIGSTVWVDKGVKGLAPNGRNADGTLNNREFTTDKVLTYTSGKYANSRYITLSATAVNIPYRSYYSYDSFNNINLVQGGRVVNAVVGSLNTDNNGVISNFQPKFPFRAIDYSDKSEISSWSMPSAKFVDLTLGASGSTYIAPANGWFSLNKTTQNGGYIALENRTCLFRSFITSSSSSTHNISTYIPAKKGDVIVITYNATGETVNFRFIYAEGEV